MWLVIPLCGVAALIIFIVMATEYSKSHEEVQNELAAKLNGERVLNEYEREAVFQAEIVGDMNVSSAIRCNTYRGPLPERRDDGGWLSIYDNLRSLKIAGINRRSGIDRYIGRVECALVPEPENEYDPDAIKIISDDRHHLGYIPSGQTDFVRYMSANEFPYRCTAFIEKHQDESDGHKFFVGFVYIKRLD